MPNTRHLRLQERIMQEAALIVRSLKDPRLGLVSVVRAQVSLDGEFARIYVSTYGSDDEVRTTMKVLARATGHVRTRLGEALGLRKVPEIRFERDDSLAQGQRIDEILREISPDDTQ